MIWIFLVPAAFLLLGIADMPMGYYTFMRIVVFLAGIFAAFMSYSEKEGINIWTVIFALVAILFNPIIPVYLHDKEVWAILDFISAGIFIIKGIIAHKTNR